eukprot:798055-Prymnesium_polylepis.2
MRAVRYGPLDGTSCPPLVRAAGPHQVTTAQRALTGETVSVTTRGPRLARPPRVISSVLCGGGICVNVLQ